jgi:hypothetical protein
MLASGKKPHAKTPRRKEGKKSLKILLFASWREALHNSRRLSVSNPETTKRSAGSAILSK